MHLAFVLGGSDRADRREEAAAIAREWVHPGAPSMMFQGIAHEVLARVAARRGDPGEAWSTRGPPASASTSSGLTACSP